MTVPTFDEYVASLSAVSTAVVGAEPEALELCARATERLQAASPLDREAVSAIIQDDPHLIPVLAAALGLSKERFRGWLTENFDTAGWVKLGRTRASDLVEALDDEMGVVAILDAQAAKAWTWADALARTMASGQRATSAIEQGRALEDAVETVVAGLGLPFDPRTRFEGSGGRTGPADFAIPGAGPEARIAIGVKGYDSTGSKLSDAATEIETMAKVRRPNQYIFAVVDGRGWRRRRNDLRRIHTLWTNNEIDGVYNLATLGPFRDALDEAARRLALL